MMIKALTNTFYVAPPRFAGGAILNILGYHILRVAYFAACFNLRQNRLPKNERSKLLSEQLLNDGIVAIPNYF